MREEEGWKERKTGHSRALRPSYELYVEKRIEGEYLSLCCPRVDHENPSSFRCYRQITGAEFVFFQTGLYIAHEKTRTEGHGIQSPALGHIQRLLLVGSIVYAIHRGEPLEGESLHGCLH